MMLFENRLKRDFHADKPGQKWVTDISYMHTTEGILYGSAIKDVYGKYIAA